MERPYPSDKRSLEIVERHLAAMNKELHEAGYRIVAFPASYLVKMAAGAFDSLRKALTPDS